MMKNFKTKDMVLLALLMALRIILGRYLAIDFGIIRISFGFIVMGFVGYLYGPTVGFGFGMLGDFLGYWGFPQPFPYFPGYTLSAGLSGFFYGLLLYYKKYTDSSTKNFNIRIIVVTTITCILCNVVLGTLWTSIVYGKAFKVLIVPRLLKNVLCVPIESIVLIASFYYLAVPLRRLRSTTSHNNIF